MTYWFWIVLCASTTLVFAQTPRLSSSGTVSGPGVITSESWSIAKASVENPTDEDQKLVAAITFHKDAKLANVQFAREFWIPANSKRDLIIPFKSPDFRSNARSVDAQIKLFNTQGSTDILLGRDSALYRTSQQRRLMVKIVSPGDDGSYNLASHLQEQMGQSHRYVNMFPDSIPEDASLMANIYSILLSHNQMDLNPLQIQALRQWLLNGGQLIILLPETGMDSCRALLGDHLQMQVIQKTSLNQVSIEGKNILTHGNLTSRISNKQRQPRGWDLGQLKQNRVDIHNGGTRFRNPNGSQSTIVSDKVELSASWSKIKIQGRVKVQNSNHASGSVMQLIFFNKTNQPIGKPIDLVNRVTTRWQNWNKEITIPHGATQAKIEVGIQDVKGTLWASGIQIIPAAMHFEKPVSFWRTLAPSLETDDKLSQDGWPMMFRKTVGRGKVTLLTVGAAYWSSLAQAGSNQIDEAFRTTSSMILQTPLDMDQLILASTQQIGYEVLSRTPVMFCLLLLFGIMILTSIVLWKKSRPELLAPISVVLALIIAAVIWGMGVSHHRQTPLTVSSIQLAQIDPISNVALTDGVVCTYSPTQLKSPLSASNGGVIWPDLTGSKGKTLRLRWTDSNRWQWDHLELPEGALRTHQIHRAMPLDQPVNAIATFNEQGLVCKINAGPYTGLFHPIIASKNNHCIGKITDDNTFTATTNYNFGLNQFVASSTMSAQDIQRQRIFRSLIYNQSDALNNAAYPKTPSAMWWAHAMDMGFEQGGEKALKKTYALVTVPLTYQRPAPGSTIKIPSVIMQPKVYRKGNRSLSTILNPMTGKWTSQLSQSATFKLAFPVPKEILPVTAVNATLDIDFKAAGRSLIVTTQNGEELFKQKNIASRIQIPVTAEQINIDKEGLLILGFEITEHDDPNGSHMWDASGGIRLELTAVTK